MNQSAGHHRPVLIVDLAKRYGGAEVRVLDTAKALHGRYPYAVATLADSPLHRRLEASELVSLPIPFSRGDPRLFFFFWRAIRQQGYTILDAHNVQSQFWVHLAATLAGNTTKVSTVHSAYKFEHNNSLKGKLYEQVLRLNRWWGIQFVAVSEAVLSYLQNIGVSPERVSLIHNSIHLPPASPRGRNLPVLESLGWDETVTIIIVVARLEPVKGHKFLIEALNPLTREKPQLRCLIVGEGRSRAALEDQVKETNLQDRIHFTGFRDDIPALMSASDLFCLPSLSEGLPYAVLEACAHRLPLLVTRVGGMAELLTHNQTAFLVPPADSAALAEGLRWLVDHPEEAAEMGQTGYQWLQQQFSLDEMIARTLAVYYPAANSNTNGS